MVRTFRGQSTLGSHCLTLYCLFQAFWLKTDFNKWKDEDESDDEVGDNMDLAQVMQPSLHYKNLPMQYTEI